MGCALASLSQYLARVTTNNLTGPHPLGAETYSNEKVDLGVSKLTCSTFWIKVHLTSFAERRRDLSRSFLFRISCLIPETFAIKVGSCVKSHQSLHVCPKFLRKASLEFLDLDYKAHPYTDHEAKFHGNHGDRPRELGDPVAK